MKKTRNIIKYETVGPVCITTCPYLQCGIIPKVGSAMCAMCVQYKKKDKKKKEVYCTFGRYSSPKYRPAKMHLELAKEYGYVQEKE